MQPRFHSGVVEFLYHACLVALLTGILVLAFANFVRADEQSFDTRVVLKLSEMLDVKPPTKIFIERVEQKELLGDLRHTILVACMMGRVDRFQYCSEAARESQMFVHGIWLEEKPEVLRIKLHRHAGLEALIHEYCHWYLHYRTKPYGLINNHEILVPLTATLLTSPEFVKWLEKEEAR